MSNELKNAVRDFWQQESCGTRYMEGTAESERFAQQAAARYTLEPYIPEFAGFSASRGKQVLEIGVGLGADFIQWCRGGAHATGVDLTAAAIQSTQQRCAMEGFHPELRVADAENLPFPENSFDVVYSWGVLHHTPDTPAALREVWRVLRPGGEARIMIYARPSWVALMLWVRYGLLAGKPGRSLYDVVFHHLESPGTKTYSDAETRRLFAGFTDITLTRELSPGDLLLNKPSARYQGAAYRMVWSLYPRFLIRPLGSRFGLFVLIRGRKPRPGTDR